jgi:KDO2-lipid IV(A) lauroyltransferase
MRKNRKLILENMDTAYGNTVSRNEKIRICKEVFISIVLDLCETIQIGKISDKQLLDTTVIEGEENLKEALKQKKGVVGICPHMGNFPKLQAVLTKKGLPVNCFSRPPSGRHLAKFFKKLIGGVNVPLIYVEDMKKAIKESLKWLAGNGVLGIYIDQHSSSGVEVEFFNRKVLSPTGAAVFARKFNCPVVGFFTFRLPNGKQKIIIEGPYPLQKTDNSDADIQANTAFFMQRVEHYVREHPEQWFTWLHKRFRPKKHDQRRRKPHRKIIVNGQRQNLH